MSKIGGFVKPENIKVQNLARALILGLINWFEYLDMVKAVLENEEVNNG